MEIGFIVICDYCMVEKSFKKDIFEKDICLMCYEDLLDSLRVKNIIEIVED